MTSKVNARSSQIFNRQVCYKCNKNVFQLEQIIVGDHALHESCFICEKCNQRLTNGNYVELDGNYYCNKDSPIKKEQKNPNNSTSNSTGKEKSKIKKK